MSTAVDLLGTTAVDHFSWCHSIERGTTGVQHVSLISRERYGRATWHSTTCTTTLATDGVAASLLEHTCRVCVPTCQHIAVLLELTELAKPVERPCLCCNTHAATVAPCTASTHANFAVVVPHGAIVSTTASTRALQSSLAPEPQAGAGSHGTRPTPLAAAARRMRGPATGQPCTALAGSRRCRRTQVSSRQGLAPW